jgi:hypothetical protein
METIIKPDRLLTYKVGCDPEFMMFYGNRKADAHTMFQSFFKNTGMLADQGIRIAGAGDIGTENSMGEMRPLPGQSPEELVRHIETLIKTMHQHMPFLDMTTLSIGTPAGGHIHLDMPQVDTKAQNRLVRIISTMMMPIFASEHRLCAASRYTQSSYGHANDIRYDRKGNSYCIELRAFTSEWICTPKIALATLAYLSVVWNEAVNKHPTLAKEDIIFKNQPQIEAVQRMILADYKPIGIGLVAELARLVRTFELYPIFKEECELILNPEEAFKEKEQAGWELFQGWGLRDRPKPITKRSLLADKTIKAKVKMINADLLNSTLSMPFNNDYNVEIYAKALAERTAALQWQLKNEYFLYGLKKGIEGFTASKVNNYEFYAIPTNASKADVIKGVSKMKERFLAVKGLANGTRINPKTGKVRKGNVDAIVIGLPYNIRVDKNIKPLIELIWKIERGTITAKNADYITFPTIEPVKKEPKPEEIEVMEQFEGGLGPIPNNGAMPRVERPNETEVTRHKVWANGTVQKSDLNNIIAEADDDIITPNPF